MGEKKTNNTHLSLVRGLRVSEHMEELQSDLTRRWGQGETEQEAFQDKAES